MKTFELTLLRDEFAVCRLGPDAEVPQWASEGAFSSVSRTPAELSIVCAASAVPGDVRATRDFRCLEVRGPFEFSEIGVLAALTGALADAGVSVFAVSTYDTDYLFLRHDELAAGCRALREAGHRVATPDGST